MPYKLFVIAVAVDPELESWRDQAVLSMENKLDILMNEKELIER